MKKFLGILNLNFVPSNSDVGFLILRIWLGASMLMLHGWGKLINFSDRADKFADPIGLGSPVSLALAVFAEVICSVLLILGLLTRFAALAGAITMAIAFFTAHGGKLTGPGNGELAFMYLMGYIVILVAGAGRYSLDNRLIGK
jgi:putative oxidoreductase